MRKQLAIEGGNRIFSQPPPDFNSSADRTFGLAGEALVIETLRSGCLSRNGGTIVAGLERDFAETLGVAHCVACSSETSSVHLTIAALDLDPGDEVIVLPITDIGSILPVLQQNAIPAFADSDPLTMVLDPAEVKRQITRAREL